MAHSIKESRYHDFTSYSCEICGLSSCSPLILLTCEEEMERRAAIGSILNGSRKEFEAQTKSIKERLDRDEKEKLDNEHAKWLGICESRKAI